jgi:hypothetical protein
VVNRVVLRRIGEAGVAARELAGDGTAGETVRLSAEELAPFVRERERTPVR